MSGTLHVWKPGDFVDAVDLNGNFALLNAEAAPSATLAGFNRLRNGRMLVNQRGTSITTAGYASDGWIVSSTGGALTASIIAGGIDYGYSNYTQLTGTLPVVGTLAVEQRIEAVDCRDLPGATVTLSFYASASTTSGTFQVTVLLSNPNVTDTWRNKTLFPTQMATVTSAPGRVSMTFVMPPGVANGLSVAILLTQQGAPGTATLNVGGLQLELGTTATLLQHRSYADEFYIAQRYYQVGLCYATGYQAAGGGFSDVSDGGTMMRALPTVTTISNNFVNFTQTSLNQYGPVFGHVGCGGTANATGTVTISVFYAASAEL